MPWHEGIGESMEALLLVDTHFIIFVLGVMWNPGKHPTLHDVPSVISDLSQ